MPQKETGKKNKIKTQRSTVTVRVKLSRSSVTKTPRAAATRA